MKIFISLIFFILSSAYAGTCTTTTRSNYNTGQVLTSSALNADFNQLVTKSNAMDAGCLTDGTLEVASLNVTDFAAVTNGIQQGCSLSYVDANTVQVSKCILSVNGAFVKTTATNNVTWGCTSCASEVVSTQYYVYAKTGSIGTTLNLLILTTAPGADGYDALGNKVLGKFYNNGSSAIEEYSVRSWAINKFAQTGTMSEKDSFSFSYGDGADTVCATATCTTLDQTDGFLITVTRGGAGTYAATFKKTFAKIMCIANVFSNVTVPALTLQKIVATNSSGINFRTVSADSAYAAVDTYGTVHCEGY